jgi:hypothetical protein
MVPVPVPTFESYGAGSGSCFRKVTVSVSVPVPAPYLDHKKQINKKNFGNFFVFLLSKLFYKEFFYINFNKFMVKSLKCE